MNSGGCNTESKTPVWTTLAELNGVRDELRTPRLGLRKFNDDDTDRAHMLSLLEDPNVTSHLYYSHPQTITQDWSDQQLLVSVQDHATLAAEYGIFLKTSSNPHGNSAEPEGEFVGLCGSYASKRGWREIAYGIKQQHRGKGYASEAIQELVREYWSLPRSSTRSQSVWPRSLDDESIQGYETKQEEQLCACPSAANPASMRVLQKAGFVPHGLPFLDERETEEGDGRKTVVERQYFRLMRPGTETSTEN